MIAEGLLQLKRSLTIRKYPTAGRNAGFSRLAFQALPYLLVKNGYSFAPLSVFIHVNNRCNLRCKMCDIWMEDGESMMQKNLGGGDNRDMPIDDFKRIIDKIKPYRPFVGIPAAEPMMYPHIIEAIRYVKSQGLHCSVATNGTTLENQAEDIIDARPDKIIISMDGPPAIHDEVRGFSGTFDKIISGLKKLDDLKKTKNVKFPQVFITYVISELNQGSLIDFLKVVPLDAIAQINFRNMFFLTHDAAARHNEKFGDKYNAFAGACIAGGSDLTKVDIDVLHDQMEFIKKNYDESKVRFLANHQSKEKLRTYFYDHDTFLDNTPCVYPWYMMQIDTDGNSMASQRCFHLHFGNVLEKDFQDVWNGESIRSFRKDLQRQEKGRFEACSRCEGVGF